MTERRTPVQACLNGGRTRDEHPGVPLTPDELAAEGRRAVAAGASSLHLHPRAPGGAETLDPVICSAVLRAVRAACPGVPIGLTTSLNAEPDPRRRLDLVHSWQEMPDMVSVNLHEEGALALCALLIARGIAIEAGIWTLDAVEIYLRAGIAPHCVRVLIEAQEDQPSNAAGEARAMGARLHEAGSSLPQLHHGEGPATWAVLRAAIRDGHEIRIGLEDVLVGPQGEEVGGNADLVRLAVELVRASG